MESSIDALCENIARQIGQPKVNLFFAGTSLVIEAPSRATALALVDNATDNLANSLVGFGGLCKDVKIRFPGCSRPFRVPLIMASKEQKLDNSEVTQWVFGGGMKFDAKSLAILERMKNCEKPMSLVNLATDAQEWVNLALANMLAVTPEQATELNMKDYWEEDALAHVKRRLKQQGRLEHRYEAFIPAGRRFFSSTFEVVQFGNVNADYRLVTIHECSPVMTAVV